MTNEAVIELRQLRKDFATLVACLSPWIGIDEMCQRYGGCTTHTLKNMERDGRIPFRKQGRWSRNEVVAWERNIT